MNKLAMTMAVATVALATPALAGGPFNPRPTTAYECSSLAGYRAPGSIWTGYFAGRKETGHDYDPYETVRIRACFVDAKGCKNWLYNMQSEYVDMVWAADCRKGLQY